MMKIKQINNVELIGTVHTDPMKFDMPSGKKKVSFIVKTKTPRASKQEETNQWHNIVTFGDAADEASSLKKGDRVYVFDGTFERYSFEKEGRKRYRHNIVALKLYDPQDSDDVNLMTLAGYLGKDPVLAYTKAGNPVAEVSLATNRNYRKNDEWHTKTTWHRCVIWGEFAEFVSKNYQKGDPVQLEGYMSYRKPEKYNDYVAEVVTTKMEPYMLDLQEEQEQGNEATPVLGVPMPAEKEINHPADMGRPF
jgi:single-strand DNA-binding protein